MLNGKIEISLNGVSDNLHEVCPGCSCGDCYFECDGSHTLPEELQETEEQAIGRIKWNGFVDGIMSLLLALSAEGHDIESMESCVQTALDAGSNNLF